VNALQGRLITYFRDVRQPHKPPYLWVSFNEVVDYFKMREPHLLLAALDGLVEDGMLRKITVGLTPQYFYLTDKSLALSVSDLISNAIERLSS
jgi:hypothetical protein